jgi:hypothetical protein
MKYLSLVSLIIAIVVIIQEFAYVGTSSLAWVIIGLAVSSGLVALEQMGVMKNA